MTYKYEYINTVGNMSIRPAPNTNNTSIGTLTRNVKGYGNELTLLANGDKWVKIEQGGSAVGWVAVIHASKPYGVLTEITNPEPPLPPPPTEPMPFPSEFTLTNPDGSKARYIFDRILE